MEQLILTPLSLKLKREPAAKSWRWLVWLCSHDTQNETSRMLIWGIVSGSTYRWKTQFPRQMWRLSPPRAHRLSPVKCPVSTTSHITSVPHWMWPWLDGRHILPAQNEIAAGGGKVLLSLPSLLYSINIPAPAKWHLGPFNLYWNMDPLWLSGEACRLFIRKMFLFLFYF